MSQSMFKTVIPVLLPEVDELYFTFQKEERSFSYRLGLWLENPNVIRDGKIDADNPLFSDKNSSSIFISSPAFFEELERYLGIKDPRILFDNGQGRWWDLKQVRIYTLKAA